MSVGVLLPTKDDGDRARTALGDILSQSLEPDEIVIVDDSEEDYTKNLLQRFEKRIPKVRVIDGPGTTLGAALNLGIEVLGTDFIARMDADDRCDSTRLEKQVEYIEERNLHFCGTAAVVDGPFGEDKRFPDEKVEMDFALGTCPFIHGSVLMRRDAVEELGGYDESYTSAEDYELWLRAIQQGYRLGNVQSLLYTLNLSDDSIYGERLVETKMEGLRAKRNVVEGEDLAADDMQYVIENDELKQIHLECSMERLRYSDRRGAIKHAVAALPEEKIAFPMLGLSLMPGFVITFAIRIYRKL